MATTINVRNEKKEVLPMCPSGFIFCLEGEFVSAELITCFKHTVNHVNCSNTLLIDSCNIFANASDY
jgi:hypothetical protein